MLYRRVQRGARRAPILAIAVAVFTVLVPPVVGATASAAEVHVRRFAPRPLPPALYRMDVESKEHWVTSKDGTQIFTETWLPVAREGGPQPPATLPTVLVISPYTMRGKVTDGYVLPRTLLVERGYAFTSMHVRGTGSSEGCNVLLGKEEGWDGAAVIEYLGRDAPWSGGNGRVGTLGVSYSGTAQLAAALGGTPEQVRYLKAMVIGAPAASYYDYLNQDGVPSLGGGPYTTPYYALNSFLPYSSPANLGSTGENDRFIEARTNPDGWPIAQAPERARCQPDNVVGSSEPSGNVTEWYAEREWRRGIEDVDAAVLMYHGHQDINVPGLQQMGLFNRITAKKAGIFGEFPHVAALESYPYRATTTLEAQTETATEYRTDFFEMVVAWFDQHLNGIDAGTQSWPVAQVQGTDKRWRAEPDWPTTGGPAGQLALSAGRLGGEPIGPSMSFYRESIAPLDRDSGLKQEGTYVAFDSGPLPDRLEVTGMPILDLWLELDTDDAHIGVELRAFDEHGQPIEGDGSTEYERTGRTVGFRSMRHLDPFVEQRFVQATDAAAPKNTLVHTMIRLRPTDIVVPRGGKLQLTIGGMERWDRFMQPTEAPNFPSLANAGVTIHHDCQHPTVLRFVMPRSNVQLLDVEVPPEMAPAPPPIGELVSDGGGVATAPVCGQAPKRIDEFFGPER